MNQNVPHRFGLYAILTDPLRGYEYVAHVLAELEVPFVQLRMKDIAEYRVLKIAQKLRHITEHSKSKLIINDYPRVAYDSGADGVHIGQDDMPFEETRLIVGQRAIIGLSTHTPEQAEAACVKKPDYIGIGPVFATPAKKIPDPVIGIDGMKKMLEKATVPAVCIGGITLEKLPEVLENGAANFCMVREICNAEDPRKIIMKIMDIYKRYSEK